MRLLSLKVQNFGRHRFWEGTFSPRLNAIVGGNGSGKSTLLNAALACLTGDFSRTEGNKLDNVHLLAPQDERAFVQLRFEHGGVVATVTRHLRPAAKATFEVADADQAVLGERNVNAAIANLLFIPVLRRMGHTPRGTDTTPLASLLFSLVIAFVVIPGLVLIGIVGRQGIANSEQSADHPGMAPSGAVRSAHPQPGSPSQCIHQVGHCGLPVTDDDPMTA